MAEAAQRKEVFCTPLSPWDGKRVFGRVKHINAVEVGDQEPGYPSGDIVTMRCPNCGHQWREELPQ